LQMHQVDINLISLEQDYHCYKKKSKQCMALGCDEELRIN